MSVTHYADVDEHGIEFVDSLTLAPIPSLCGDGEDDDLMTMFSDDVTCPACLAAFRPQGSVDRSTPPDG